MADHSIKVVVDLVGERALESLFDHVEHIPDDWRDPFEKMAEDFWDQNKETFDAEGPGWKPLAQSTKWDRVYKGFPVAPILVRTGALRDSLTGGFAKDSIFEVFPTRMEIGTSTPYAMYHQTGNLKGKYPPGTHPPKRSPVVITSALQKKWDQRLVDWLRDEINYQG
ncbi:phage virion morphogenesis protein [Alicyclobacillus fastidiosus]|uniref:Phage virion morphogenesis protein n=1 Tax=Alicyclobacillus fastidiosus TaxID=392011 RepID=A0ABV5AKT7_9BACL|nr:phage virion morphogenesis protein [Alicyclobacillus fastidiosus]WEH09269.1 phage virion morphogenesis protein [Alicyclobacillus fastidiosus]